MNGLNVSHRSKLGRHAVGVLALVSTACSLRSLDDLQTGEPAGGTGLHAGGATNSGGTSAAKTSSSPSGGTAVAESTNTSSVGGSNVALGGNDSGGASAAGGISAGFGGMTPGGTTSSGGVAVIGGTTSSFSGTGGSALAGGTSSIQQSSTLASTGGNSSGGVSSVETGGTSAVTTALSTGGTPSTGGLPNTGGANNPDTGGAMSSGGVPSAGGTGTGGATVGGTSASSSTGGAGTGGAPSMTYNVPGQSCLGGFECLTGVSCCAQIQVPSGSFQQGTNTDSSRNSDESPQHAASVDAFVMDQFEVTVGRFRRFYQAYDGTLPDPGAGAAPKQAASGWQIAYAANMPGSKGALQSAINCNVGQYQTWTEVAGVNEKLPMNCVSWYVAFAFCVWDGGRLPSEAEWEKAASSGASEWRFPWGSTDPDASTTAVMNCLGDGTAGCSPSDILPVGSRPLGANAWGHLDLAGSVWEWTLDYYDATYYQAIGTCDNCVNTAGTTPRVIRGGNFLSTAAALRATGRASKAPITADPYTGFRCVRTP